MPMNPQPVAEFQAHAWATRNIADVPGLSAMLSDQPELVANASITYGRAARLAGLATSGFEQRVARGRQANNKQELNRWIKQVFLDYMNNAVFQFFYSDSTIDHRREELQTAREGR